MARKRMKLNACWLGTTKPPCYAISVAAVLLATGIRLVLEPFVGPHAPYLPFVVAVIVTARFAGRAPSLVATALSSLSAWYFFVEPRNSFGAPEPAAIGNLLFFVGVNITISFLIGHLREALITTAEKERMLAQQAQLIDLSHDAVITVDGNRAIKTWNTGASEMYGWTEAEAAGKIIDDLLHSRAHLSMDEVRQVLVRDGRWEGELIHTARDGAEVTVESRHVLIRGEDSSPVGSMEINRDITKRKWAEDALRESLERLEKVLEIETVGVMFWDLNTGCMVDANDAFLKLMGYSRGEVEARELTWQKLTPREFMDVSRAEVEKFLATGRVGPYEKEYFRKDGTRQWLLFAGSSLGNNQCVEFCVDTSARKKAELALSESESQFRTLANAIPQLCWMANPDGWIFWYNQRWYEYTGTTPAQMEGWGWKSVHDPEILPNVLDRWQGCIVSGEPFEMVFPLRSADGEFRPFLTRVVPVRDSSGKIVQWFGTNTDITEQRKTEEELRASEQRVRQKLESVLSPDVGIGEIELRDILDAEALQSLMDDFYELAHVPVGIIDTKGEVLVKAGWQEICTRFHRVHPDTLNHCIESDTCLTHGIAPGDFKLYKCKNNLCDVATPFVIADRHLGNLFTGQFLLKDEPVSVDLFASQAAQYGFGEQDYLAALDRVPRMSKQTAQVAISFLRKFGDIIGKLSYANVKLAKLLTELESAQHALRQVSEQRGLALEAANLGAWDYHFETGDVFWDGRCRDMWGVSEADQFNYHDAIARIHADDRAATNQAVEQALAGANGGAYRREFRVIWPDGSERWIASHGRVQFEGEGNERHATRFVGVNADITDRKQAEHAILQLNATLERRVEERTTELTEANRELEAFSYSVSHDLRAPLRSVEGFAKILLRDYSGKVLDEVAADYMHRMSAATHRMGELIADLLSLSRLSRQEMIRQQVDLSAIASSILAEYQGQQPKRHVTTRVEPGLVAHADPQLARVALENLLGNAWKYTGKTETATITFGASRDQTIKAYFVCDNGAGFDMAHADQLFAPFQRLHGSDEFEGNGIGLATVQRVVRRHGGRVWAEGKPGKGAVFYFTLGDL